MDIAVLGIISMLHMTLAPGISSQLMRANKPLKAIFACGGTRTILLSDFLPMCYHTKSFILNSVSYSIFIIQTHAMCIK